MKKTNVLMITLLIFIGMAKAGLVGHWPLDDGQSIPSTLIAADAAGAHNGDIQGYTTANWVNGVAGGAIEFNGSNQRIDMGYDGVLDQTNAFTLCLWFNKLGNANEYYGHLAGKNCTGGAALDSYFIKTMPNDTILFSITENGTNIDLQGAQSVPQNQWTHVAVVFEPSVRMAIYVDGQLYAEKTTAVPASAASTTTHFTLGQIYNQSTGYAYYGQIDDVRLYDNTLGITEIQQVISESLRGATNPIPANGETCGIDLAQLEWTIPAPQETGFIVSCDVLLSTNADMSGAIAIAQDTTANYTSNLNLTGETVYYWQVICKETIGGELVSTPGAIWNFNTINPAPEISLNTTAFSTLENSSATVALSADVTDGDGFSVLWTVESKPDGSTASLINETSENSTLIVDSEGVYIVRITATDSMSGKNAYKEISVRVYGSIENVPFTILALPDTQFYSESYPQTFVAQTQWIVDNMVENNIVFVSHLGDIVQTGCTTAQWQNADVAMAILDNAIPYGITIGNHDLCSDADRGNMFRQYFGANRFATHYGYGGHSADQLSSFHLVDAGPWTFISLHLDIDFPDSSLQFAQAVLDRYPGYPAIISTHLYLADSSGRQLTTYVRANGNAGQTVWENFISKNNQIFMTINGHWHSERMEVAYNDFGNVVYQIQVDYQSLANGGNGWLQYYVFKPAENVIQAESYSPVLNQFQTDANSSFAMPIDFAARFNFGSEPKPVAHWKLDGNANDENGLSNGTLEDFTSTSWTEGKFGQSLEFNGTSNNVDCGASYATDLNDAVTMTAWVYITGNPTSSYGHLIGKNKTGGTAGDSYYTKLNSNRTLSFGVTPDANFEITTTQTLDLGKWYFLAFVYVPSESMSIYVNGQVSYRQTNNIPGFTKSVSTTPFTIGQIDTTSTGYAFNGKIDDVKLYAQSLSDEQITAIYNDAFLPYCTEFSQADINHDCYVNISDLLSMFREWLNCTDENNPHCQL